MRECCNDMYMCGQKREGQMCMLGDCAAGLAMYTVQKIKRCRVCIAFDRRETRTRQSLSAFPYFVYHLFGLQLFFFFNPLIRLDSALCVPQISTRGCDEVNMKKCVPLTRGSDEAVTISLR